MWHWNSLWAPAPGDPPAVDDPALWQTPWTAEQVMALQARSWEAMLSASHSWWTMTLSAWPVMPIAGWTPPTLSPVAIAGIEPLAVEPPADETPAPARKRSTPTKSRQAAHARKR